MRALNHIKEMGAYKPPLAGRTDYQGLLLDFNERTVPLPNSIKRAIIQLIERDNLPKYPDYFGLEEDIASYAGVDAEQVLVTNGSDQAIDLILRTFAGRRAKVIIPEPSFVMYSHFAKIAECDIASPYYTTPDLAFPFEEVLAAIDDDTRVVVVSNPNNPTGTEISIPKIAKIATKAKNSIIYVDEAYFEFSNITAVELIKEHPNIIVTRTFSKAFGLASLRIGYCLASAEHIAELLKVRGPYAVNGVAYYAARATLKERKSMESYVKDVMVSAKPMVERFFDDMGVKRYPSSANFILVVPTNAHAFAMDMKRRNVMVRPRGGPNISNTLRITIGTTEQMRAFIENCGKVAI